MATISRMTLDPILTTPKRSAVRTFDPLFAFVAAMAAYVTLQSLAVLLSSGALRLLSYATAFGIVLAMATIAAFLPKQRAVRIVYWAPLVLYLYGSISSALVNFTSLDMGNAVKMMLVPLFLVIGAAVESQNRFDTWEHPRTKQLFCVLIFLPMLLLLWQLIAGRTDFSGANSVSIFSNRNNAALYAVTLIALLNTLRPNPVSSPLVFCVVGVSFGTLGVLLAVIASLAITIANRRVLLALAGAITVATASLTFFPLEYGIFSRIRPVIASIKLIASGRINIETVTYGELVGLLQTTDLSFLFRLKHWINLWDIYIHGPIENIIFGFGVGSSTALSTSRLVPHNDYLRMLFECGPVTFLGFVTCIILTIRYCGRRFECVPLLVVSLYFFTENLIDNFAAMTVFFFSSGAMAFRINNLRHQKQ